MSLIEIKARRKTVDGTDHVDLMLLELNTVLRNSWQQSVLSQILSCTFLAAHKSVCMHAYMNENKLGLRGWSLLIGCEMHLDSLHECESDQLQNKSLCRHPVSIDPLPVFD